MKIVDEHKNEKCIVCVNLIVNLSELAACVRLWLTIGGPGVYIRETGQVW